MLSIKSSVARVVARVVARAVLRTGGFARANSSANPNTQSGVPHAHTRVMTDEDAPAFALPNYNKGAVGGGHTFFWHPVKKCIVKSVRGSTQCRRVCLKHHIRSPQKHELKLEAMRRRLEERLDQVRSIGGALPQRAYQERVLTLEEEEIRQEAEAELEAVHSDILRVQNNSLVAIVGGSPCGCQTESLDHEWCKKHRLGQPPSELRRTLAEKDIETLIIRRFRQAMGPVFDVSEDDLSLLPPAPELAEAVPETRYRSAANEFVVFARKRKKHEWMYVPACSMPRCTVQATRLCASGARLCVKHFATNSQPPKKRPTLF